MVAPRKNLAEELGGAEHVEDVSAPEPVLEELRRMEREADAGQEQTLPWDAAREELERSLRSVPKR